MRPTEDGPPEPLFHWGGLNRGWLFALAWILLWAPLSLTFPPYQAHVPVPPFLMPLFWAFHYSQMGFRPQDCGPIYAPAIVFWFGLILILGLRWYVTRSARRSLA